MKKKKVKSQHWTIFFGWMVSSIRLNSSTQEVYKRKENNKTRDYSNED